MMNFSIFSNLCKLSKLQLLKILKYNLKFKLFNNEYYN